MKRPAFTLELYKSKTLIDGRHPVIIRVAYQYRTAKRSIGSALVSEWDPKNVSIGRPIKARSRPDWNIANDDIENEYTKYLAIFKELREDPDFQPSDVFLVQRKSSPMFEVNALEYLEKLKPHARRSAQSRLRKIMRYAKEEDFHLSRVDERWIEGFKRHCKRSEKNIKGGEGNSDNTINYAIKFIGRVASYAGYPIKLPRLSFTVAAKEKLTLAEIDAIRNVNSKAGTLQWHARNTFLLQFYLRGMRIGDLITLPAGAVKSGKLSYRTSKSDKAHVIELLPAALDLLKNYPVDGGPYLLPWIRTNNLSADDLAEEVKNRTGAINKYLKQIAKKAGITKNVSTHIARHSFASVMDKATKGDIDLVKDMLGHSSRTMTERYLKQLREADEMDDAVRSALGGEPTV